MAVLRGLTPLSRHLRRWEGEKYGEGVFPWAPPTGSGLSSSRNCVCWIFDINFWIIMRANIARLVLNYLQKLCWPSPVQYQVVCACVIWRQVALEEGEQRAKELSVMFIETSAKSSYNVKQVKFVFLWVCFTCTLLLFFCYSCCQRAAIVHWYWHLSQSLFSRIAQMSDETDVKKTLTAFSLENWSRPPGHLRTTWMKTILQDLKCNNLSLNKAIDVAENRPLWRLMSTFGATHL